MERRRFQKTSVLATLPMYRIDRPWKLDRPGVMMSKPLQSNDP
jgi:hypothetical protein